MTFLIQQTLLYSIPLMIVALAGVFAERSGIINLALEGIMILGAFIGVLFVNIMQTNHVYDAAKAAGDWVALQGFELLDTDLFVLIRSHHSKSVFLRNKFPLLPARYHSILSGL
mgnify:FL=1